jgi:SAM-dependent methyltransferase
MIVRYLFACLKVSPETALYNLIHVLLFPQMPKVIREAAKAGTSLVDLGCGTGIYSIATALLRPRLNIVGIDFESLRNRCAEGIATRLKLHHISFVAADIFNHTLWGADTYLLCDVLCYYPPDLQEKMLWRIAEQLPPGGRLLLKDHARGRSWRNRVFHWEEKLGRYVRSWLKTEKDAAYYDHGLWPSDLTARREQLENMGFKVRTVQTMRGALLPHVFFIAEKM